MNWDESKHPRRPKGTPRGGEFAPLDLWVDGIAGREVPPESVPLGNKAFQYAVGKTVEDGAEAVFRRAAGERGSYGGWRWESDVSKLKGVSFAPKYKPKR
jgi:hypothetical protein